ncbi:MAG: hypothetical protein M3134_02735 [Actinomycetota bacterium]|nr:hypothetical protein [Actinomycetota bacterium]
MRQRRTAARAVIALFVVAVGWPPPAARAQSEQFECDPKRQEVVVGGEATIVCRLDVDYITKALVGPGMPLAAAGQPAFEDPYVVDGETLEGSVNDADTTEGPPDFTQTGDESGDPAAFRFSSSVPGVDSFCMWLDRDDVDENLDEGGDCTDDVNTELVVVEWVSAPNTPSGGGADPATTAAPGGEPPSSPSGPSSEASAEPTNVGFALVADRELSLAIDVALAAFAVLMLSRSRWLRAVVVESVRHPRGRSSIAPDGSTVLREGGA